ncbi:imelysin family protein [Tropicibacter sp. S64]|uniref:imelysin family protein n=1 Tax=Tropicibacter sp. S64 TaxID=3415122 RepID=UPI003C7E710D
MRSLALVPLLAATAAFADVNSVVVDHILPRFSTFAEASTDLSEASAQDCTAEALKPSYNNAFDAWMGISHLQLGPLEQDGRALTIGFWPDKRGMVDSTVEKMVKSENAAVASPEEFAEVSIAVRGLFALERLLYDPELAGYGRGDYSCALVQAISGDLARVAGEMNAEWQDYAKVLRTAGEPGNTEYLDKAEAAQRLYTALLSGLEFDEDSRIGRPLGTFDRPRPARAEARRSGRSLRNVVLSLEALRDLARALSDRPIPKVEAAFDTALQQAAELEDPVFASVDDPMGRLKVEVLGQSIGFVREAVEGEIGAALNLTAGFNSADGD